MPAVVSTLSSSPCAFVKPPRDLRRLADLLCPAAFSQKVHVVPDLLSTPLFLLLLSLLSVNKAVDVLQKKLCWSEPDEDDPPALLNALGAGDGVAAAADAAFSYSV